jgi:uridine phosphorylase
LRLNDASFSFEMETSAIYGLGKLLGHRTLSLSAIVANRVDKTFSKDPAATVTKLISDTLSHLVKDA